MEILCINKVIVLYRTFYHVKCRGQAFIEASLKHQEGGHYIYLIVPKIKILKKIKP